MNRSWLAVRFFKLVFIDYHFRFVNVQSIGPPTRLPQTFGGRPIQYEAMCDLHTALRTEVEETLNAKGLQMQLVRLRHGKDNSVLTLHVNPTSFSTSGLQSTDMLSYLGFTSGACPFLNGKCFATKVPEDISLEAFGDAFTRFSELMTEAEKQLATCGYRLPQPEAWGHFFGRSARSHSQSSFARGDGHRAAKHERMKESEDSHFHYVFTWIEGDDKGWVTHYRPKNDVAKEMMSRFRQLFPDVSEFSECPEFEFSPCWWRFEEFEHTGDIYMSNANYAHGHFDAHANSFAGGLSALLASDALADELRLGSRVAREPPTAVTRPPRQRMASTRKQRGRDVFLCHASKDKQFIVDPLCNAMDNASITYWFDSVEIKWGDSVTSMVNRGLAISEYIVVVLSPHFVGKPWPERELNAALNLESTTGNVVVLPLLAGDDAQVAEILKAYPLLNDKRYIRWSGDAAAVIDMLQSRLGRT